MMATSTTDLKKVLRGTRSDSYSFVIWFGEDAAKTFVQIFEPRLCGGMELPISEAVDSLLALNSCLVRTIGSGANSKRIVADGTVDLRIEQNSMHMVERVLKKASQLFDSENDLNDLMGFFRGIEHIARELESKDQSYFAYDGQTRFGRCNSFGFFAELLNLMDHMPKDEGFDQYGKILSDFFYNSVKFSSSLRSAFNHLEIVEKDLGMIKKTSQRTLRRN